MSLPAWDRWVWIYEGGGYEIMEKAFNTINLHLLSTENWPFEMAHGNKPIKSLADLKGKKFRTGDPRLMQKIGVAAVTLPWKILSPRSKRAPWTWPSSGT